MRTRTFYIFAPGFTVEGHNLCLFLDESVVTSATRSHSVAKSVALRMSFEKIRQKFPKINFLKEIAINWSNV